MPQVVFDGVTFRYGRGKGAALDGLTLELGPGIVGLVGPNGAGKTSFLKLLMGVFPPERGRVTIGGVSPDAYRRRHGIGFIPEQPVFPPHLTVGEFLSGLAALASGRVPDGTMDSLAGAFGSDRLHDERLGEISLGQKRRVELAATLLGSPPLLLLDEPTNGLDPLAVSMLRSAVVEARRDDRLIIVSSHHLDELQRMVDRVVMIDDGRLLGIWASEEIERRAGSVHDLFHSLIGSRER